jgi:hypothetical protein
MPLYERAIYAGETVSLENRFIRLDIHRSISGWGWGELYTPSGKLMGVLEHLGEIMIRDQDIPMRLEAEQARHESGELGERLSFHVKSIIAQEKLAGSSFEKWIRYPFSQHCLEGEITFTLAPEEPVIYMSYKLKSNANTFVRYIRGPWLKIGESSFGVQKDDAIFPGIEWVMNDEWSSGTDWFKDPWAMRWIPHPNKVAIPLMALSHEGTGIGMAWNPNQLATQWFNYRRHCPQPVFASPNFVDRMNNHLMGLMVPSAEIETEENKVYADPPLELHLDQLIEFDAEIFLSKGNSLQVILDWIKRHDLPEVPEPRWSFPETLDRIASAYNSRFWYEYKGFGNEQNPSAIGPHAPSFADRYIRENADKPLAKELKEKVEWCRQKTGARNDDQGQSAGHNIGGLLARGRDLLDYQRDDGSFYFDPDGRHRSKDDFVVVRSFMEPMGLAHDTALDICVLPATELMTLAEATGEESFKEGARKALEYCMSMLRPEGGDFWETPLHSPNLLAADHAAIAYYMGYKTFGDHRYKDKAVYWIRSILPFTHLWQPKNMEMLYNTKPCFCSSDWYFANWVRDHVQWEVLQTFTESVSSGIDWGEVDPEIDWHGYHRGITVAAMRWMVDHRKENWQPHNMPSTYESYKQGHLDDCFADTHNSVTGNYGGMFIPPDIIAINIFSVMDYEKPQTK